VYFSRRAGSSYLGLTLVVGGSPDVLLQAITAGGAYQSPPKASASAGIMYDTEYTVRIRRIQRHAEFEVWDGATKLAAGSYDSSTDFGDGSFGLMTFYAGAQFDDFSFTRLDQLAAPAGRRLTSTAKTTLDTANSRIKVESPEWSGAAKVEWAGDEDYLVTADVNFNGGRKRGRS
jgi:hypothetical protein